MDDNPVPLGRGTVTGRTVVEGKAVQIPDVLADPEFKFTGAAKIGGMRTMLGVPLLREGMPIGVSYCLAGPCGRSPKSRSSWYQPSPTRR